MLTGLSLLGAGISLGGCVACNRDILGGGEHIVVEYQSRNARPRR